MHQKELTGEAEELSQLHFLASLFYGVDSKKERYKYPVLWLCLEPTIKEKYMQQVTVAYNSWKEGELQAKNGREDLEKSIKTIEIK